MAVGLVLGKAASGIPPPAASRHGLRLDQPVKGRPKEVVDARHKAGHDDGEARR
jgi:hypothetical protein